MPRIKDLEHIRDEVYLIGDEKETLKEWNEAYEVLPLPEVSEAEANNNFDAALSSIQLDDVNTDTLNPDDLFASSDNSPHDSTEVPEDLLSETKPSEAVHLDTTFEGFPNELIADEGESVFKDGTELNDSLFDTTDFNADDHETAIGSEKNAFEQSSSAGNKESISAAEAPNDDVSQLDLSSIIMENPAEESDASHVVDDSEHMSSLEDLPPLRAEDISAAETEASPADAANAAREASPAPISENAAAPLFQDGKTGKKTGSLDELSADSFEDFSDIDFSSGAGMEASAAHTTDNGGDSSFTDDDFSNISLDHPDQVGAAASIPETDRDFDIRSNISAPEPLSEQNGAVASAAVGEGEEKTASAEGTETAAEDDPYKPVEELPHVQVPEIDEATGFAKKEGSGTVNPGFTPPEKFQNFVDEHGKAFVTAAAPKASTTDMEGGIPLAISEQDFKKFLSRLENMPLNVRKEIQYYLAYDDDLEASKMELVDLIIKDAPLKKIVRALEDTLKKSIKIPKDFDKKSVEELEREKKTLKYRLRHQILPLITIAGILTLLLASIFVLGWHFIYKPVIAENYYKDGLVYLQSGKNMPAIEKFDKAGTYWKKKRWYFRYADAFRRKKQYSAAESIYLRLLTDFNHDVAGGIAYAQMLSLELRDYQKAETVLRRQVLDYHPQSEKAFYALANVYLDWGLEDASKLEEASKIFSSLLQRAGHNDAYNAGMMKYYIRTNQLAKVLPFKDYFLKSGKKILQSDLNELNAYLLDCLYEPSSHITPELKARISDLREVLEKSHQLHDRDPEANYLLGRFFVYNYNDDKAEYYLKRAVDNYGDEILPLNRFFKKLDALRLYGELFLLRGQQLEAETIFSNALNLYRNYSAISELPRNKVVGKLFEDYGNIKYFIANDYALALETYRKATAQNADSASIRYKMGYIHYQLQDYDQACTEFGKAYAEKSNDVNLLFSLGNALFKRADYQLAQAYYERLMETLDAEKIRRGIMLPQLREIDTLFVENYMKATNNLAVALNRLAVQQGNSEMNARSFALFAESTRAWDALTRNPSTLIRVKNQQAPAYVNVQYMSVPDKNFVPEIYTEIPKTLENERILVQVQ